MKPIAREALAEFFGTFILVLFGLSVTVSNSVGFSSLMSGQYGWCLDTVNESA